MTWDTAAKDIEAQKAAEAAFDTLVAQNAQLAKAFASGLKKQAGAATVRQNYVGTGRAAFRRQVWVRFRDGSVIDLWVEGTKVCLGGVVCNGFEFRAHTLSVETYDAQGQRRPDADVVADVAKILNEKRAGAEDRALRPWWWGSAGGPRASSGVGPTLPRGTRTHEPGEGAARDGPPWAQCSPG